MMTRAGIYVTVYKPHSVRSAAASKAKANNVSFMEIMKTAGWSSAATFAKFYDRKIVSGPAFATSTCPELDCTDIVIKVGFLLVCYQLLCNLT